MNRLKIEIGLFLALVLVLILSYRFLGVGDYLSFESVNRNKHLLRQYVEENYLHAVAIFILAYMATAFMVPGALPLTLLGGFVFGAPLAVVYVNFGAISGAAFTFMLSRHIAGNRLQRRFSRELERFNEEIRRNGERYLIAIRVLPAFPFFMVNYFAGLTRVPLKTFLWTTALGMLPGSVVYTYAGQQLGTINSREDLYSPGILVPLLLAMIIVLLPVIYTWKRR